uniref:Uncharacterized protein n=1 Tax=Ciona savignyi TaxID=51511 RepID=H2Z320_CIOSA
MLQQFEKECLSNQVSLLTLDTDSEVSQAFGTSSMTSDDLEVAVHLERKNSDETNEIPSLQSHYGSLPRPRKEK